MFQVQKTQCDQCLFSKNKIVEDSRKEELIKECLKKDTHFVCHKQQISDHKGAQLGLCCRGFYDRYPDTRTIRTAQVLRILEFIQVK